MSPREILIDAASRTVIRGSSTCCIAIISDTLKFANIGDSGFLLLRNINDKLEVILKSLEQCHSFNFPFQVNIETINRLVRLEIVH